MARIQVLGFSVHRFLAGLASSGLAVGLALIVGAFLIGFVGVNPFSAYLTMLDGSFRNLHTVSEMLVKVSPQILASLSFLLAFRCGLFNIGAEGQIYVGGLFVTVLGIYAPSDWPPALLVPLGFCAGFLGGGIWGGIAGFLKARFRVHEIVSTIMMNYIAIFLIKYMVEGPLQEASGAFPQTDMIADGAQLPLILLPTRLHAGFFLAIAGPFAVWAILARTTLGFRIRSVGANPRAARANGISVERSYVTTMIISGGLAGLAGYTEIAGIHYRLLEEFSRGYGFEGIAIALLARANAIAVIPAALLFAILALGANAIQRTHGIPAPLVVLLQGLIILFIIYGDHLRASLTLRRYSK